jgi:SAGA-associated factor 29
MNELKESLESQWATNQETPAEEEDELMRLCRENLKIVEDATAHLEGPSENEPNSLLGSLNILKALRQSSENDHLSASTPVRATGIKARGNLKRKAADSSSVMSADDRESLDGPPNPVKATIPSTNRLKVTTTGSRAGSAAPLSGREASIKIEEGVESGAEMKDSKANKAAFVRGTEVFYRSKKASHPRGSASMGGDDGEGILCTITTVIGEGKARRYEIIDVEPEEGAAPYSARSSQMVIIPASNDGLPDPHLRKTVLAMYPSTTTFYRAEVTAVKGKDVPSGHVKLKFEDEDEKNKESVVEKRYTLTDWP